MMTIDRSPKMTRVFLCYDMYGELMPEQLAIPATRASKREGGKAFKHISSIEIMAATDGPYVVVTPT